MHSPSTSASPFCSSCGSKGVGKLSEEALEEVHAISSIYAADARVRLDGDVVAFAPHQPPAALGPSLEVFAQLPPCYPESVAPTFEVGPRRTAGGAPIAAQSNNFSFPSIFLFVSFSLLSLPSHLFLLPLCFFLPPLLQSASNLAIILRIP
eukprot:GHVT01101243.1.p1 GENE.GHVT01101243.1~~GHVT01101243.1.p1  ORF type:complete len:151 (-),score=33.39 GHVT01101243.1:766-1218(-)